MWLLHARFVWSGLIPEHCSLSSCLTQCTTMPSFNAGLKQDRFKSWDSAYPPLPGSSHIARSIPEKSLILDSYPGYLLTEHLHTCLHLKNHFLSFWIYSFQTLSASEEHFFDLFVWPLCQQLLTQTFNGSCYLHPSCLLHSLDFFQLLRLKLLLASPSICAILPADSVSHHGLPLLVTLV